MYLKRAFTGILFIISQYVSAQTTYLQLGSEDYHILDRLETRSGRLSPDLYLGNKPVQRKGLVKFLLGQRDSGTGFSKIDQYNIDHAISVSSEWAIDEDAIDSKYPWFKTFYKKQPDLVRVNNEDFFFSANPVLTAQVLNENNNPNNPLFTSNRGLEVRGLIVKKLGFYTFFTDNQEETPAFVSNWVDSNNAVPGADFYTKRNGKYDYLLARGYFDFALLKNHLNVTFGYDKHFLGNGMRSMFLSDFSAAAPFLRLNTRIWKFNYTNLYMELTPQFSKNYVGPDPRLPRKYATMHHLSINATRWLNVGLFEGIMFARKDRYEFGYMIPIILYRQIERAMGSPDNALLGFDFKAIAAKHLQFYGQVLLDEFTSKELIAGNGYWANKFAIQVGAKYFDAFTVKNLDLQGEINLARPFTYARDSVANYTHYNQPLAHPLGASFAEILGQIKYQPVKNLFLSVKGMYYTKGQDTGNVSFGGNLFKSYNLRTQNYGVELINGVKTQCALMNFTASYELKENLFIDLGATHRVFDYLDNTIPAASTTYFSGGVRLNFTKRDYDFY
jgi:hypothetical protein